MTHLKDDVSPPPQVGFAAVSVLGGVVGRTFNLVKAGPGQRKGEKERQEQNKLNAWNRLAAHQPQVPRRPSPAGEVKVQQVNDQQNQEVIEPERCVAP